MTVERVRVSTGMEIAYERFGEAGAETVLLVMGLGAQMLAWSEDLCRALVARGLHVIRFDNRDVGLSTHVTGAPTPNLPAVLAGDLSSVAYTLSDMARDAAGLLEALGLDGAHVVGASLGGAIGQHLAIEHPGRVRSLTSMMSTTGDRAVGQPNPEAVKAIFGGPRATTREEVVEQAVRAYRVVRSPGFPPDEAAVRERAERSYDRSHDPLGVARQAIASVASGDRTARLRSLAVPTLVIHGVNDLLCDASGGRATAAAIPGAELLVVDGMGHDLPRALWPEIVGRIARLVERSDGRISRG